MDIVTVKAKDTPVSFEFIARTESSHLVNIQARVNGFLDERVYTEGDMVEKDQVLFLMDKKPFIAQVNAAEAALERKKAAKQTAWQNLQRTKPLTELNALSEKDLDDATGAYESAAAEVEQAKAELETALLNLSYCTIRSPIKGMSSYALKQDGSYLNIADSQLTTIVALDPMWVNFSISENQMQSYRDQIKKGSLIPPEDEEYKVEVVLVDGSLYPYTGEITFTEPYYNSETGTFLIRASVINPDGTLVPNQFVHVKIKGAYRPNAIVVPQKAVHQSAKGHYVWTINEDEEAAFRPVEVGEWHGEGWFIEEGLQSGDRIVVEGSMRLQAGQKVNIQTSSD
ncbi:MAG: efflux RND transporter periplasmic adaptor subunit [Chlamydiales bacterium]